MKVVSFVPSLTETLIECGVDVVGRTRYCIHPTSAKEIPVVGGTKNANWSKVYELNCDLVLFDREENTAEMAEECQLPYYATHVSDIKSLARELMTLGERLKNSALIKLARRAEAVDALTPPSSPGSEKKVVYMIWKNPWMAVGPKTFIADVLAKTGREIFPFEEKYPVVHLDDLKDKNIEVYFSSEPYPFLREQEQLSHLGFTHRFVDGEHFSWFGIRSLRYLESILKAQSLSI